MRKIKQIKNEELEMSQIIIMYIVNIRLVLLKCVYIKF